MTRGFIALLFALLFAAPPDAQSLPPGFQLTDAIVSRTAPTGVYFAHDGRVFVTEKSGLIWLYRNLLDPAPRLFADLTAEVHDTWDRGLLGFALDPRFPEAPYAYALYTYNGGLFPERDPVPWAPRWPGCPSGNPYCGVGGGTDDCPTPPGPERIGGGCVVSGRLVRLTVSGDAVVATQVLVEDWYQQFPSHSIGTLQFGPDGYLYASAGEGASYYGADFGEWGNTDWPDRRAPLDAANQSDPARNQGGALRAQGLEIEAQYRGAVWLSGTLIRIDPATGLGALGNPLAVSGLSDNARRIVAYGLRNPFRFTFRPGTGEAWIGNVGYNTWEAIAVMPPLANGGGARLTNFGWPCFEGRVRTADYSSANLPICTALYANANGGGRTAWTPPWYVYVHTATSDITGLAFYEGSSYPAEYRQALFFADDSRGVIFQIPFVDANHDGFPDPPPDSSAAAFLSSNAVQLTGGPGGDLFLTNIRDGRISRVAWCAGCSTAAPGNLAPSAAIALAEGSSADGLARTVGFSAANSVDPNAGDTLVYDWDLDGDGVFGDASGVSATRTYTAVGRYHVGVRVRDPASASDVQRLWIVVQDDIVFRDGFDPPAAP